MAKKPTRNKKDPLGVGEFIALEGYNRFLATRSPLDAFQSLDAFLTLGINPPPELLEFFNQGFKKYVSHKGAESLDKCFGLVLEGKGHRKLITQQNQPGSDFHLCGSFWMLKTLFGLTSEQAAHSVSQLFDSLAEATIADRWGKNKEWKAIRKFMDLREKGFQSWDKKARMRYLNQFPIHSLPEKIQELHPHHPNNKDVDLWKLSLPSRKARRKSSPK